MMQNIFHDKNKHNIEKCRNCHNQAIYKTLINRYVVQIFCNK